MGGQTRGADHMLPNSCQSPRGRGSLDRLERLLSTHAPHQSSTHARPVRPMLPAPPQHQALRRQRVHEQCNTSSQLRWPARQIAAPLRRSQRHLLTTAHAEPAAQAAAARSGPVVAVGEALFGELPSTPTCSASRRHRARRRARKHHPPPLCSADLIADQKGVPRAKVKSWTPYAGGAPASELSVPGGPQRRAPFRLHARDAQPSSAPVGCLFVRVQQTWRRRWASWASPSSCSRRWGGTRRGTSCTLCSKVGRGGALIWGRGRALMGQRSAG